MKLIQPWNPEIINMRKILFSALLAPFLADMENSPKKSREKNIRAAAAKKKERDNERIYLFNKGVN